MSGIAGIYYLDGRPVDPADLQRMVNRMAHRGPDGIHVWHEGSVGLGHCMLHTTPESLYERFPTTSRCGNFVLTADARMDNREELISALQPARHNGHPVTDGELILPAYERWGADSPKRLLGDFAFAVWNKREQMLFCARDHFGVKPLYYYSDGSTFAFASEIKALTALPFVTTGWNEDKIAECLSFSSRDSHQTIYSDIRRIPPAHRCVCGPDREELDGYWHLEPAPIREIGEVEATERFVELFRRAVKRRLRSRTPVAIELSGGLDSSSIACTARDLAVDNSQPELLAISMRYPDYPESDEGEYIRAVLSGGALKPHEFRADTFAALSNLDKVFARIDDFANTGGQHNLVWHRFAESRKLGARTVLTGYDGDTVIWHGYERLHELVQDGEWETFSDEVRKIVSRNREAGTDNYRNQLHAGTAKMLNDFALPELESRMRRMDLAGFLKGIWFLKRYDQTKILPVTRHCIHMALFSDGNTSQKPLLLNPRFAEVSRKLWEKEDDGPKTVRQAHLELLRSGRMAGSLEGLNHYAASHGVEARHPFMDRDLVAYCVSLPSRFSYSNGWSRYILRIAMEGIVPDMIRWRPDKTNLGVASKELLFKLNETEINTYWKYLSLIGPYIDQPYLESIRRKRKSATTREVLHLGFALSFACWAHTRKHHGISVTEDDIT